ncbi:hypothetical protein PPTG_21215 [Phytophthora nicotianae INRA-310]|uniref:PiggyBac transposable element-derived protein 4 C-terminal zinc-ribbon domain-containing protein n=1 Tax=Phytophthora nicotianae (strain INRA-310) TaxID=761204 RepID=W2R472_PHYN3|nr:hypothetical protein PPTG_21215 [Phytophthora nicotianae INRA-310]ETN20061.1 hypothetical protein PPTG_21215 [Phytophthora nicotianae INRA-310]
MQLADEDFKMAPPSPSSIAPNRRRNTSHCFLCPKARRGTDTTCFQVWYNDFACGALIPSHLGKRVVLRRAPKAAGVRNKTHQEILSEEKEES